MEQAGKALDLFRLQIGRSGARLAQAVLVRVGSGSVERIQIIVYVLQIIARRVVGQTRYIINIIGDIAIKRRRLDMSLFLGNAACRKRRGIIIRSGKRHRLKTADGRIGYVIIKSLSDVIGRYIRVMRRRAVNKIIIDFYRIK